MKTAIVKLTNNNKIVTSINGTVEQIEEYKYSQGHCIKSKY